MKAGLCRARLAALIGAGSIALTLVGCVPPGDQSQATENADLRAMVASDQQQINAMQEKIGDLNDQLTELQHNGGSGDDQNAAPSDGFAMVRLSTSTKPFASRRTKSLQLRR